MKQLQQTIKSIQPLQQDVMKKVQGHVTQLAKPIGALGRIEELAIQIAGITGRERPTVHKPAVIVAAADHGIVTEGVSAYPQDVTKLMLQTFVQGKAAINVFSNQIGAEVYVVDVGVKGDASFEGVLQRKVKNGTANFLHEDAMTRSEAVKAIEIGIALADESINKGHELLITGEMGIGNTTASSAITAAITSTNVEDVVGRGTGLNDEQYAEKIKIIENAIVARNPNRNDGLDVLSKVGGLEIALLTGVILQGASRQIPVIVDGFISSAAALTACSLCPTVQEHLIISHQSVEQGQRAIFAHLKKKPLLSLDLRLGEGTGAALAYPLIQASTNILTEMATFSDLGLE
ncbi:nicotinate-nucleotide--dimethylbenzimidazole phosphoribosyltransferase [Bacillus alkalicellulosilyticus]|uniref:nicotinate-nucleotide--dimethylbenzimidazole phosphoribosyltransferase n=1 Tax=Alkalihalobacterium alkalicellulosilyticum TaxID=1912214 RepID=UPI0009979846|nr:nicotinate-nucleotide--dimethylbenzimidazole phosphoribosyltransferase [Bacillus alkalicellulosilyticus]